MKTLETEQKNKIPDSPSDSILDYLHDHNKTISFTSLLTPSKWLYAFLLPVSCWI